MIQITIDTALGTAKLQRLQEAVDEPTMLEVIKNRLVAWMDENFKVGGIETKWAALRPLTIMLQKVQHTVPLENWRQKVVGRILGNEVRVGLAGDENFQKLVGYQHYGTSPYEISVVNKKVLAALLPRGLRAGILGPSGRTAGGRYIIFGKTVQHPGLPPRPVIPSERLATSLVVDTLNAILDKATKGGAQ